jgi:endogenous inhibitor of DNA gyrase (YacG/DUF329 family)
MERNMSACPICSKPAVKEFQPFCSKRCADVDLSRWLKGSYAIPGEAASDLDGPERPGQPPARPREDEDD